MNTRLLIAFILFLLSCSPKENEPTTNQKTCKLKSIETTQGVIKSITNFAYNDGGLLIQRYDSGQLVRDGSSSGVFIQTYMYDKDNFLVKSETSLTLLDQNGKSIPSIDKRTETYTYNIQGQIITKYHFGTGYFNEAALSDTYEYSNNELKQATINSYAEKRVLKFNSGIPSEMISTVIDATGSDIGSKYELNEQGFIKTIRFKTGVPERQYYQSYTYNEKGQQTKLNITVTGYGPGTDSYTFEYDDKKNPNSLIPSFKGFPQYDLYGTHDNNGIKKTLSSSTGTYTTTWAYDYNSDGYPGKSQMIFSSSSDPVTTAYTYIQCN